MAHRSPRGKSPPIAESCGFIKSILDIFSHFTLIWFVFYALTLNYEIDSNRLGIVNKLNYSIIWISHPNEKRTRNKNCPFSQTCEKEQFFLLRWHLRISWCCVAFFIHFINCVTNFFK
jgi:hypothetical protein